ncbi:hypothetical protein, partial [Novosphingobium subterraneum]
MARDDGTSLLTPELIVAEKVIAHDGARSLARAEHGGLLGVTCLQDAPYMAAYECFDSYSAFE